MPGKRLGLAGLLAELLLGLLVVAVLAYVSARAGLGNPFTGLGASQGLGPEEEKALKHIYGLDKPLGEGLLGFLAGLLRADTGPSILYNKPAFSLALGALPWTLLGIGAGFLAAYATAAAWIIALGPRIPRPIRALSFIPGYFYAVLLLLSSWWLGWPPPLPGHGAEKLAAYILVVWLALWPRLLHGLAGIVEDPGLELGQVLQALRAIGAPEHRVNAKLLRTVLAPYTAYAATMLGMVLERSAILEPLLGYTGLGLMLYRGVASADPVLAATAFTLIGAVAYLVVVAGRLAERALDPRLATGAGA